MKMSSRRRANAALNMGDIRDLKHCTCRKSSPSLAPRTSLNSPFPSQSVNPFVNYFGSSHRTENMFKSNSATVLQSFVDKRSALEDSDSLLPHGYEEVLHHKEGLDNAHSGRDTDVSGLLQARTRYLRVVRNQGVTRRLGPAHVGAVMGDFEDEQGRRPDVVCEGLGGAREDAARERHHNRHHAHVCAREDGPGGDGAPGDGD